MSEQFRTQSVDLDPLGEATRQRAEIKMTGAQLMDLIDERDALLAGLRLVRSMPVNLATERNGYDCAGCNAPLGEPHRDGCAWEKSMGVLRSHRISEFAPESEQREQPQ